MYGLFWVPLPPVTPLLDVKLPGPSISIGVCCLRPLGLAFTCLTPSIENGRRLINNRTAKSRKRLRLSRDFKLLFDPWTLRPRILGSTSRNRLKDTPGSVHSRWLSNPNYSPFKPDKAWNEPGSERVCSGPTL